MTIREQLEALEAQALSENAALSAHSRGREREVNPCPMRTCYQRDRDRIIHSKAFRRLSNKTQVFISPEGDHYRARLTHTLEVAQIGRTVARALRLNEDLTEAIALGHDLGHTPFGHAGETALASVCPEGFRHNEQSLRVVERIEHDGRGLNLTWEVRDGIVCHTGGRKASTQEGRIIHFADRIAYVNHDIDDALRAGLIGQEDIPKELRRTLGDTHGSRIDTLVSNMITYGERTGEIGMDSEIHEAMLELRKFNFRSIYRGTKAQTEETRAMDMLRALYGYYDEHPEELPEDYRRLMDTDSRARVVCDYVACMTDRYSIMMYKKLFIPKSWNPFDD
ncbi:MAG: deoxyguanosinetriphosphate triphosphohydrolase [Intestinibacillus sp.]